MAQRGRINLEEPLESDVADFCTAHYGAPQINIIREALRQFIDARLSAEPEVRKRFDAARKARLQEATKLSIVTPPKD